MAESMCIILIKKTGKLGIHVWANRGASWIRAWPQVHERMDGSSRMSTGSFSGLDGGVT
jgi:hypothetical protein